MLGGNLGSLLNGDVSVMIQKAGFQMTGCNYSRIRCKCLVHNVRLNSRLKGAVAGWLTPRTPNREVEGSSPTPTRVAMLCP